MPVSRFGVSLEQELLKELDDYAHSNRFANRSQAIRHLIEKFLVEEKWKCHNIVAGAVTLVFGNDKKEIPVKIAEITTPDHELVRSVQYFHLNKTNNLAVITVMGPSSELTNLSEKLISLKGIQHGKLVMSKAT